MKRFWMLLGAAIGAAMMYVFDPNQGERRRATLRDQAERLRVEAEPRLQALVEDVQTRAQPLVEDVRSRAQTLVEDVQTRAQPIVDDVRSRAQTLVDDVQSRAQGLAAEARSRLEGAETGVTDSVLTSLVRAEVERVTSDAAEIEVAARQGRVTLTGHVPSDEVRRVLDAVRDVPGVSQIDNLMSVYSSPDNNPIPQSRADWPGGGR